MTQTKRLEQLLTRKRGVTSMEIIGAIGTVCPHKRMSELKARGSLHKATGKFQAQIKLNGSNKYIGLFESISAAADAYDQAAVELFGEFARTNKMLTA